jgi:hypothetical protein
MGAAAGTYQVGTSRPYKTVGSLPVLRPGDVVEIDPGTYSEVKRWINAGAVTNPITVRGVGSSRPVFDATGLNVDGSLPHPRAVFQVEASNLVFENLEFKNARNGDNGAGIRVTSANNVTVRNCRITMCDMGMMSDHDSNLRIERSEIAYNGTPLYDGYSHNFYLGGDSATVQFCYIHDSLNGQNFKTRAHYTELIYNYITDSQDGEVGLVDAAETAATNSNAVMIGNVVVSKPRLSGYNHGRFVQFGQDSGGAHNGTLFAFNNTFVAGDGRIQFLSANAPGAAIVADNNIFHGSDALVGTLGGGIGGLNNWAPLSAVIPAAFAESIRGSAPGFVDLVNRDLRLAGGSPCRNRGLDFLSFLDGEGSAHSGLPVFEYVDLIQSRPRVDAGYPDLGAHPYRRPVITAIQFRGRDCLIDFTSEADRRYNLQRTLDFTAGAWITVLTNIPGTDLTVRVIDTNGAGQPKQFYRVVTSM